MITRIFQILLILPLSACNLLTPKSGRPIDPAIYESLAPGRSSQLDVRRAIGYGPAGTRYEKTGQIDIYGIAQYSGKNYIPGYVFVTGITNVEARMHCTMWWFQYDGNNILSRKWIDHACTQLDTRPLPPLAPASATPQVATPVQQTQVKSETVPAVPRVVGATFGPGTQGISVLSVDKNSVAARAGLRAGDLITHISGRDVTGLYWEYAVAYLTTGKSVSVRLMGRDEERVLSFPN